MLNDLACKKSFCCCSFVRFPATATTAEGLKAFLLELKRVLASPEYAEMQRVSHRKTEDDAAFKQARDEARKHLRRGSNDFCLQKPSKLACQFRDGLLQRACAEADERYGERKQEGIAVLLNL